jgi:hypothetical protein
MLRLERLSQLHYTDLGFSSLLVKGQACIDFRRNSTGNDSEDLFAEFNQLVGDNARMSPPNKIIDSTTYQSVYRSVDLHLKVSTLALGVLDSNINETSIIGLVGCS